MNTLLFVKGDIKSFSLLKCLRILAVAGSGVARGGGGGQEVVPTQKNRRVGN